jgi:hypothetical protein
MRSLARIMGMMPSGGKRHARLVARRHDAIR